MTPIKYKNFSLQNRLLITVSLIFFLTYFCALFVTQYIYHHYLNHQYQTRLLDLASNVAFLSRDAQDGQQQLRLDKIGRYLYQEKNIHFIYIYDHDGNISFIQARKELQKSEILEKYIGDIESVRVFEPEIREYPAGQMIIYPIRSEISPAHSGFVVLGFDGRENMLIANKAKYSALALSIILFLLGLFLLQRFSSNVTRPIKKLMLGTDEVTNGNFDFQMEIEDEGDLGQLARKFNEMTLKLKYFNRQKTLLNKKLNEYNESLEEKVKEIRNHCGWDLKTAPVVEEISWPSPEELQLLRWLST